mgnify:CR=1 FL=1
MYHGHAEVMSNAALFISMQLCYFEPRIRITAHTEIRGRMARVQLESSLRVTGMCSCRRGVRRRCLCVQHHLYVYNKRFQHIPLPKNVWGEHGLLWLTQVVLSISVMLVTRDGSSAVPVLIVPQTHADRSERSPP